jgi:hypothetical protein
VPLERVSFAGSLATARRFGEALLQARSQRQQLTAELFALPAADLVPHRPGRREPRAGKRRPKPSPDSWLIDVAGGKSPHQNRYYANSMFGVRYRKSRSLN